MLDNKNNKRIAKNTLLLYGRTLLTMGVSFYTARMTLDVLGVSDYGVNNIVGGIVAMGSFLNTSMASALQRFLSFELGRGDREGLREVFSTSVLTQSLAAAVVFILAETVGLWFLNTHINIDAERMAAANWVYQCAIVSFVLITVSAPYNAVLIAHEHMTAFAYFSIIEAGLRLAIVFLLQLSLGDKLIVYALLGLAVSMIMRLLYGLYCHRRFEECVCRFRIYKQQLRHMLAFSGWNMIGTSSLVFRDQGVNIILNLFLGTTVNAARAIAMQVNSAVMNFTNNFLLALSPQITKQYAEGDVVHYRQLVFTGCRFSGYLVLLMIVPLMSTMDYLLRVWLETVPAHTVEFLKIILAFTLFRTMQFPLITAIHATGSIRHSQMMICIVNLTEVIMVYIILCRGGQLYVAVSLSIFTALINLCGYVVCLNRLVPDNYKLRNFVTGILLRVVAIALLCHIATEWFHGLFNEENMVSFLVTIVASVLFTGSMIYTLGLSHSERSLINKRIAMIMKNSGQINQKKGMIIYQKFRKSLQPIANLIRALVVLRYRSRIPFLECKLKEKQQIKVVFFVMSLSMWKGDRLFNLMQKSQRFQPFAVFAPRIDMPVEEKEKERVRLKQHFLSRGVEMIDEYDCATDTGIDIRKRINPNIVFYTLPYSSVTQRSYTVCRSYWHNRFPDALICFFPYSFPITADKQGYTSLLIDLAWKLFYPTNFHKELAERFAMTKGKNMVITGYPTADIFLDRERIATDDWKAPSSALKRIIWAPHHTIDADRLQFSTFLVYADYMQRIAQKYRDRIQIAFKPHPLLRARLYKHSDWGVERTNAYYECWANMPNTILSEGDYIDLFLTSDAMIHDSGSFMVEYLYTKKPVMYLTRPGHLNRVSELGRLAINMHYKGGNEQDIEAFIENVVLGNDDPMRASRERFFKDWLLPPHNKTVAQNMFDEIEKYTL